MVAMDEGLPPAPVNNAAALDHETGAPPQPAPPAEAACAGPACVELDVGRIVDELV